MSRNYIEFMRRTRMLWPTLAIAFLGVSGCADRPPRPLSICPTDDTAALGAHLGMGAGCVLEQDSEGNQLIAQRDPDGLRYSVFDDNEGVEPDSRISVPACTSVTPFVTMEKEDLACSDGHSLFIQGKNGQIVGAPFEMDMSVTEQIAGLQVHLNNGVSEIPTQNDSLVDPNIGTTYVAKCELDSTDIVKPPGNEQSCAHDDRLYYREFGLLASSEYTVGDEEETIAELRAAIQKELREAEIAASVREASVETNHSSPENARNLNNDLHHEITSSETTAFNKEIDEEKPLGIKYDLRTILQILWTAGYGGYTAWRTIKNFTSQMGCSFMQSLGYKNGEKIRLADAVKGLWRFLFPRGLFGNEGDYWERAAGDANGAMKSLPEAVKSHSQRLRYDAAILLLGIIALFKIPPGQD